MPSAVLEAENHQVRGPNHRGATREVECRSPASSLRGLLDRPYRSAYHPAPFSPEDGENSCPEPPKTLP
jgi:hypothetical protein